MAMTQCLFPADGSSSKQIIMSTELFVQCWAICEIDGIVNELKKQATGDLNC